MSLTLDTLWINTLIKGGLHGSLSYVKGQSSPKRCFSGIALTYQELTISKTRLLQGFLVTSEQRLILECMTYKARLKLRIGM